MIEIPTTFIIGAGASVPYGLPSGPRLVSLLCGGTTDDELQKMGVPRSEYEEFATTLRRSQLTSIDQFLEHHHDRWRELGRLAIAAKLLPIEALAPLDCTESEIPARDGPWPNHKEQGRGHWLRHLWNAMRTELLDKLSNNNVNFVVFNYDRILEQFLWIAIQNTYPSPAVETRAEVLDAYAEALHSFDIVHPYGTLGRFDYGTQKAGYHSGAGEPVAFGDFSMYAVRAAGSGIHIIPEYKEKEDAFDRARGLMQESERLVFLGFGYEKTNMDRLGVEKWCERQMNPTTPSLRHAHALGSAYGLEHAEVATIRREYFRGSPNCLGGPKRDALEFLRSEVELEKGTFDRGRVVYRRTY